MAMSDSTTEDRTSSADNQDTTGHNEDEVDILTITLLLPLQLLDYTTTTKDNANAFKTLTTRGIGLLSKIVSILSKF